MTSWFWEWRGAVNAGKGCRDVRLGIEDRGFDRNVLEGFIRRLGVHPMVRGVENNARDIRGVGASSATVPQTGELQCCFN